MSKKIAYFKLARFVSVRTPLTDPLLDVRMHTCNLGVGWAHLLSRTRERESDQSDNVGPTSCALQRQRGD